MHYGMFNSFLRSLGDWGLQHSQNSSSDSQWRKSCRKGSTCIQDRMLTQNELEQRLTARMIISGYVLLSWSRRKTTNHSSCRSKHATAVAFCIENTMRRTKMHIHAHNTIGYKPRYCRQHLYIPRDEDGCLIQINNNVRKCHKCSKSNCT